ncbi:MAG: ABC transporter ATP-binding protein [Solobacterium sp.]|nr:ABC transporter ATP-binding protein [Solobacterium sp.]
MSENNRQIAIKLSGVKKMYKLGQIGGGTLQGDLQSWWARIRGKEDPNTKIGQNQRLVGQTFMALNGIDLTVYQGEALGIIGANGAGKSTMLKLLSKVTAPTDGEIDIYGRVASMLEVGTGFNGEMTGRENIYMNGAILGMTKAEIDAKMEDIIEFSEVREFIDTPVKRYSSGMYVKLAFSVAAHLDSEIMIMDEVLAVGDMAFQKKCLTKMREVASKEGRTVLYVSHNMNTIRQLCDRCIVLDKGKIIFDGDVEKAISRYTGEINQLCTHYEYTANYHKDRRSSDRFVIKELTFLSVSQPKYAVGEKIVISFSCCVLRAFLDVKFRFETKYEDGTIVGTMVTNKSEDFPANTTKSISISIDTTYLTTGIFSVDLIAFQYDNFGNESYLDGVYPGFSFEIIEDANNTSNLVWNHRYWGHIHLPDVVIVEDS